MLVYLFLLLIKSEFNSLSCHPLCSLEGLFSGRAAFVLYQEHKVIWSPEGRQKEKRKKKKKNLVCCDNPLAYLYFLEGRKKTLSQVIVAGLGVTLKNVKQRERRAGSPHRGE